MKRIVLGAATIWCFLAWSAGASVAATPKNNCLACHTNDRVMKALYKPPVLEAGGAEG